MATSATPTDPTTTPTLSPPGYGSSLTSSVVQTAFQSVLNWIAWIRANMITKATLVRTVVAQNDTTFFYQNGPTGWQGSATRPLSYWKDNSGIVRMFGRIQSLSGGTATMLTFPAGFRPPLDTPVLLKLSTATTSSSLYTAVVSASTGVMTLDPSEPASPGMYDLDLVSFPTY